MKNLNFFSYYKNEPSELPDITEKVRLIETVKRQRPKWQVELGFALMRAGAKLIEKSALHHGNKNR